MSFIHLDNLTKTYDNGVIGIKNLNLKIEKEEFIVLLGPSGCGKSTLLRLIAGLEQPSSGDIIIDAKSMEGIPPKSRNVAMVFQEYALYPHLTVRGNLAFPLKMRGYKRSEINSAVEETASLVGLSELLDRKPKHLSGGQRQRVALGRALIRKPKLFLFDEPLSNLDFNLRINLRREIAQLHRKTKITTVYVTHDQQEAMALGDKIGLLNGGEIIQYDEPMGLFEKPLNLFAASFIGNPKINLLEATADSDSVLTLKSVKYGTSSFKLKNFKLLPNSKYLLGIRAHHIKVSEKLEVADDGTISIPGELNRIENQGENLLVEFLLGDKIVFVKIFDTAYPFEGHSYYLNFDLSRALLFDAESGERVFPRRFDKHLPNFSGSDIIP